MAALLSSMCEHVTESACPSFVLTRFPTWTGRISLVLTPALVTRVIFQGKRATGVEIAYDSKTRRISAGLEVVLSLGAIHTPKVLMQSGVGDQVELQRLGI